MPDANGEDKHTESTDAVAPYARVRITVAVVVILIGLAVLAVRLLTG